ncbi:hypothetical protein K0M31_010311 [Melipona bicolor]|uniref:Uncharacterized protein n=1 Tax=Melipona bicolor TaxID=60889 RepID=A0AA40KII4_9HYME|nr:hypothetical protein K0M31_010311 [Melipona bicolor]
MHVSVYNSCSPSVRFKIITTRSALKFVTPVYYSVAIAIMQKSKKVSQGKTNVRNSSSSTHKSIIHATSNERSKFPSMFSRENRRTLKWSANWSGSESEEIAGKRRKSTGLGPRDGQLIRTLVIRIEFRGRRGMNGPSVTDEKERQGERERGPRPKRLADE